jgi:23S rRNA (uracil1939-C5)-methyltransferase
VVHGGLCIAHAEGQTIMVDGGIPGELVDVDLQYRKGRVWFAAVARVVEASPHRVEPPCPYVPDCGGCQLQHVAYAHQLELKRDVVLDAMRRQHVELPGLRMHGMEDPWSYRWRGEFHVVPGAQGMRDAALGFNRARSWQPIAVEDCLIHHPRIRESLPELRRMVRDGARPDLTALHLTAGEAGSELLVRPRPRRALDAAAIDAAAERLPEGVRWGTEATTLRWRGHDFRVTPESFIQVNWTQMDVLYTCVLDALGDTDGLRIIDAYAGIGVMSVAMAGAAREVVCIESNRSAATMGQLNARINGVESRLRFVCDEVETALAAEAAGADVVVLDPPRAGCAGSVTGWLALAGPPRIIYVSCDPATLARDLRVLATSGPYTVVSYDLVDMFPQTHHIESVVALERCGWA